MVQTKSWKNTYVIFLVLLLAVSLASATDLQNIEEITPLSGNDRINITTNLDMQGNNITNTSQVDGVILDETGNGIIISNSKYAIDKNAVDVHELDNGSVDDRYLNRGGDYMIGELDMNGYNITNFFNSTCTSDQLVNQVYENGSYNCIDPSTLSSTEDLGQTLDEGYFAEDSAIYMNQSGIFEIGESINLTSSGNIEISGTTDGVNLDNPGNAISLTDNQYLIENGSIGNNEIGLDAVNKSQLRGDNCATDEILKWNSSSEWECVTTSSVTNDDQTLTGYNNTDGVNDTIYIENGNNITIRDDVADADADPTNELQNLSEVLTTGNEANQTIDMGGNNITQLSQAKFGSGVAITGQQGSSEGDASADKGSDIAIGRGPTAKNGQAIAIGNEAEANEYRSLAIGSSASVDGSRGTALGYDATVDGGEIALGYQSSSTADGSVAIGNSAKAPNEYEATFGNLSGAELDLNVTGNATIHGSGGIGVADGSAENPSIYFKDDENNGIYLSSTNELSIANAGTQSLQANFRNDITIPNGGLRVEGDVDNNGETGGEIVVDDGFTDLVMESDNANLESNISVTNGNSENTQLNLRASDSGTTKTVIKLEGGTQDVEIPNGDLNVTGNLAVRGGEGLDLNSGNISDVGGLTGCEDDEYLGGDGTCKTDQIGSTNADKDLTTSNGLTGGEDNVLIGDESDVDISIADQGVGQDELDSNVAGDGLSGGNGNALTVDGYYGITVDGNGVQVDSQDTTIDVASSGIDVGDWSDANDLFSNGNVTWSSATGLDGGGTIKFENAGDLDSSGNFNGVIDISDESNLGVDTGVQLTGDSVGFDCSEVTDTANDYIVCSGEDLQVSDEWVDSGSTSDLNDSQFSWSSSQVNIQSGGIGTSQISDGSILEADLSATNNPSDTQHLTYDSSSGGFTWVTPSSSSDDQELTGYNNTDGTDDTIYIENGNNISIKDDVQDSDHVVGNEIQNLSFTDGNPSGISNSVEHTIEIDGGGDNADINDYYETDSNASTACSTDEFLDGDGECTSIDNLGTDNQTLAEVLDEGTSADDANIDMNNNNINDVNTVNNENSQTLKTGGSVEVGDGKVGASGTTRMCIGDRCT